MVQECGHLQIAHVGVRQSELLPHCHCQRCDALGMSGRHHASELGCHGQGFDRLPVRAGRLVEPFERVPGGEQWRGEQQRSPDSDPSVTVDAPVADRHQHARRGDRQPGEPAPGLERRAEAEQPARAHVDQQLRARGGRERAEHRRDLLAPAEEVPRALVRGVRRRRDRDAFDEDRESPGTAAVGSAQQDRHELRAEYGDRVLAQAERRRQHDEHRVRERQCAAILEPQRQ